MRDSVLLGSMAIESQRGFALVLSKYCGGPRI